MPKVTSATFRQTPYWLNFVYAGQMFTFDYIYTVPAKSAGIDGVEYGWIEVPAKGAGRIVHILSTIASVNGGGPITVELYEDSTITPGLGGSYVTTNNYDRRSTKVADAKFGVEPDTVVEGNLVNSFFISTGGGGNASAGAVSTGATEMFLKPGSHYALKLINPDTVTAATVSITHIFYESGN